MQRHCRRRERHGFTLLEVMLVVGILAVLAMFVVPNLIPVQTLGKQRAAEAAVGSSGTIALAVGLFHQQYGRYPEQLNELVEKPMDHPDDKPWSRYVEPTKFKDPWGHEFVYKAPGDVLEDGYDLLSVGPDAEEGTADDVTNYMKR